MRSVNSPTFILIIFASSILYAITPLIPSIVYADSLIGTIPVGQFPYGAVYDPDNSRIYVADYGQGSVSVIDARTNSVVATIDNVGVNPREIAYNSNNKLIYVANTNFGQPSGSVSVIDPNTNQVIKVITASIGRRPTGITYLYYPTAQSTHSLYGL